MRLNTLAPAPGHKKDSKRVGRGIGSGTGKTAGRGHKGLKSRSGGSVKPVFLSGELSKAVTLKGLAVTKGAKAAIESAGGKIEE